MGGNRLFFIFLIPPVIFLFILLYLMLFSDIDVKFLISLFYGFIVSSINFILGILSIRFGLQKSDKIFLIVVFGGLVIRLFITLILILIALKLLLISRNSFIFTTFILYFYYLIVEIFILTQKKSFLLKTKQ
jgi:hypothetical protein